MRNSRFPKSRYIRTLEKVYAELNAWEGYYRVESRGGWWAKPQPRLKERADVLADLSQKMIDIVVALDDLERLS
jgi:hypothetical protein